MALAPLLALPMSLKGTGFSLLSEKTENAVQTWSRKLGVGAAILVHASPQWTMPPPPSAADYCSAVLAQASSANNSPKKANNAGYK